MVEQFVLALSFEGEQLDCICGLCMLMLIVPRLKCDESLVISHESLLVNEKSDLQRREMKQLQLVAKSSFAASIQEVAAIEIWQMIFEEAPQHLPSFHRSSAIIYKLISSDTCGD